MAKQRTKQRAKISAEHEDLKPNRKVGRYVLLLALLVPLAFFAKQHVTKLDMPKISLPSVALSDFKFDFSVGSDLKGKARFTNVIVDGEFHYSNKELLKTQLVEQLKNDFIRLDLSEIQTLLLGNEWFRTVSVSRRWPSTLHLVIEEHKPIARWGSVGFINRYGELVYSEDVSVISDLPLLYGDEKKAYELAKSYLTISQLMQNEELYITELRVSEDGDWFIELDHEFELALGRRSVSERIERFLYIYATRLKPVKDDLLRVDMRYQSGIAVKWNNHSNADDSALQDIASR